MAQTSPTEKWIIGEDGKSYPVLIGQMRARLVMFPGDKWNERERLKNKIIAHWHRLSDISELHRVRHVAGRVGCSERYVRDTIKKAGLRSK